MFFLYFFFCGTFKSNCDVFLASPFLFKKSISDVCKHKLFSIKIDWTILFSLVHGAFPEVSLFLFCVSQTSSAFTDIIFRKVVMLWFQKTDGCKGKDNETSNPFFISLHICYQCDNPYLLLSCTRSLHKDLKILFTLFFFFFFAFLFSHIHIHMCIYEHIIFYIYIYFYSWSPAWISPPRTYAAVVPSAVFMHWCA